MQLTFNENNKVNLITEHNEFKFQVNYDKNKHRIDGYCNNFIDIIDYNYSIDASLDYILKNSYFITITFSLEKIIARNIKLSEQNSPLTCSDADLSALLVYEYRDFYNRFTKKFTGDRNFLTENPHPMRPITYAFLDAEGTRWNAYRDEYKNIHIHAIMVIPDRMHHEFKECMTGFCSNQNMASLFSFKTIDIQRIHDYGLGNMTIPYVFSYASKFIPQNSKQLICKVDQEIMPRYGNKNLDFYH